MECKLMQQRSKIYGIQLTTSTWTVLRIHYIKLNSASVGGAGNLARFQTVWLTGVKQSNWDKQIFGQQMLNIHHIQQMPLCFALQPNFCKNTLHILVHFSMLQTSIYRENKVEHKRWKQIHELQKTRNGTLATTEADRSKTKVCRNYHCLM